MALHLKVKKTLLKRKIEGVVTEGFYGRVITNGTKTFEDILKASTHGSKPHHRAKGHPPRMGALRLLRRQGESA